MANFIINLLNKIIEALASVFSALISFLPNSPFSLIDNSAVQEYLPYLNWIIPINLMITILESWLVAIATYYICQVVLRWVKAIE